MADDIKFVMTVDNRGAVKSLKTFKGEVEGVPQSTTRASAGVSSLVKTLGVLGTAFGAIKLVGFAREIIDVGSRFETLAIQMRAVTGSAESADAAMAWIKDFVLETPYQIEQVSSAFVRLKAMGLDPMDGTMQAIADTTSKLGGSMETMDSIVLALGKSYTVGKLSMEEMRMMMERGVPVIDILADKLDVSNEKIAEMSRKGQLTRETIGLLIEGMQEWAGPASISLMDSFAGKWSNLKDHITNAMAELALDGGLLDAAKSALDVLIANMPAFTAAIKKLIDDIGKVVPIAIELGKALALIWVTEKAAAFAAVIRTLPAAFTAAATGAGTLTAAMGPLAIAIGAAVAAGEGLSLWLDSLARHLDRSPDYEKNMKALSEAITIMYGSQAEFVRLTGMSIDQAAEYIEQLKEQNKLAGRWAEMETLRSSLLKTSVEVTGSLKTETKGAGDAVEEATNQFKLFGFMIVNTADYMKMFTARTKATVDEVVLQVGPNGPMYKAWVNTGTNMGNVFDDTMTGVESTFSDTSGVLTNAFSDLLGKGFIGELESFSDLWDSIWQDLAKSMVGIIGDALSGLFSGRGEGSFWQALQTGGAGGLGGILGGLGTMGAGMQQGGTGGMLMGGLGGALAGFAIGSSLMPAGMLFGSGLGPLGAIAGAVVGSVLGGLFGGEDKPGSRANIGLTGGSLSTWGHQGFTSESQQLWVTEQVQRYRDSVAGMNNILRIFGDSDLFSLIGDAPEFSFEGGTAEQVATIFREQWLPEAMRQMFETAINQGLGDLGMSQASIDQLWSELGGLVGSDQIPALEGFVSTLSDVVSLFGDMDWQAIQDETRQNSFQSFMQGMSDALSGVQMQMLGLDQMTLLERGEQARTIEQMIVQARQAEINYLRQLNALQDSLNRSIDQQIEGIRTGGMSTGEARRYYEQQIQSILASLGGAGSPEEIQQLMADLQRYVGLLQGNLGDSLYNSVAPWGGETWADYLVGILEEGRALSNEALDAMRDQIQATNEALIAELQRLIEALTNFGDDLTGGGKSLPVPDVTVPVEVNVNIEGDKSLFVREVRSIVGAMLRQAAQAPGAGAVHGVN